MEWIVVVVLLLWIVVEGVALWLEGRKKRQPKKPKQKK